MSELMVLGLKQALWLLFTDNVWMAVGAIPFWDQLRVKKSTMITWMVCVAVFQSVMTYVLYASAYGTPIYAQLVQLRKLIYYGLIVLFYVRGFEVHWTQLVFVFLFLVSASTFVNTAAFDINKMVLGWDTVVTAALTPSYPATIVLLNIPAGLWIGRYFIRTVRPQLEDLSPREMLTLCGIPAVFLVVCLLINVMNYRFETAPVVSLLNLLIMAAGLAAFVLNMRLMRESSQRSRLAAENAAIGQMLDLQQRGYAQLSEGIERTRAQRHDMRFHLNVLAGYIAENANAQASEYLNEYRATLDESSVPNLCANQAVDILARHYVGRIESLGIQTDVRLQLPEDAGIPDADLCIVFGNLMENALNSLQGQGKRASFRAHCESDKDSIVITMDNTCPQTQEGPLKRGVGLNSVAAVAEKHGGVAQFERKDGVFEASVILYVVRRQ